MSSDNRLLFSDAAVEFVGSNSRRNQIQLFDRARELAADPHLLPDYATKDADDRNICHLMVGDFIFTYWIDDAESQILITEIDHAI